MDNDSDNATSRVDHLGRLLPSPTSASMWKPSSASKWSRKFDLYENTPSTGNEQSPTWSTVECDEEELDTISLNCEPSRSLERLSDSLFTESEEVHAEASLDQSQELHQVHQSKAAVQHASKSLKYGVKRHLAAFIPYVDKNHASPVACYNIDEQWIDIDRTIKTWLNRCDEFHQSHCFNIKSQHTRTGANLPLWLIDVDSCALVRGTSDKKYFALSYVWGQAKSTYLTSNNLQTLRQPGAFKNSAVVIPQLIIDVMKLIAMLGKHYLWVDRFCIVQDSPGEKKMQLDAMAHIYAGAYATIIAASKKHTTEGLYGIRGLTRAREINKFPIPITSSPAKLPHTIKHGNTDSCDENISNSNNNVPEAVRSTRTTKTKASKRFTNNLGGMVREREMANSEDLVKGQHKKVAMNMEYNFLKPSSMASCKWVPKETTESGARKGDCQARKSRVAEAALLEYKIDTSAIVQQLSATENQDILVRLADRLMNSDWGTRGWTFQESLFSKRKIIFQDEMVNWECHCIACHEQQALHKDYGSETCHRLPSTISPGTTWPDAHRYARLISLYNQRDLTYPEDIYDAFAGALSVLNQTFVDGFISGLPQMFFDAALIWQPYSPMTRREIVTPRPDGEVMHLPTWSWVGWRGDVDSKSLRSCYNYMRKNPDEFLTDDDDKWEPVSWHTRSTVQWSYLSGQSDTGTRIHHSGHDFYNISQTSENSSAQLPMAWKLHSSENMREFYTHTSDPKQTFWYPIPLQETRNEDSGQTLSICTQFLCGKTRQRSLYIGRTFDNPKVCPCLCVWLLDDHEREVGFLRLNTPAITTEIYEYPSEILGHDYPRPPMEGSIVDLIELSAGSVRRQETEEVSFDEWNNSRSSPADDSELYEFYNVMMTEKCSWYSTRVAIGRVEKSAWEYTLSGSNLYESGLLAELVDIDVVLG